MKQQGSVPGSSADACQVWNVGPGMKAKELGVSKGRGHMMGMHSCMLIITTGGSRR